ncbi:MAG: phosphoglycolate phosphatase [Gammaproteobacteria bacterium]|nr:phosphoglycolate phosphatase [Gammaproteobacteria bacterium]
MNLKTPKMVLIDLVGTLVDSAPDLAICVDETLKQLGLPPQGLERVRDWVGNGVEKLMRRALTGDINGEPDAEVLKRAMPVFLELYEKNLAQRSQLFPGIREGMAGLKAQGIMLGCVTNKIARFTEPLLKQLGVRGEFGIVVSGDTLPQKKPHPAPLLHAAQFFGVTPGDSLMVGDSVHDVEAARAAGFQVVCVSYGYNHGTDIRAAQPDAVIDSLLELPALFSSSQTAVA